MRTPDSGESDQQPVPLLWGSRARVNMPNVLDVEVGEWTRRPLFACEIPEHVRLDLIDDAHLRQRLLAAHRQFQFVRVEVELH